MLGGQFVFISGLIFKHISAFQATLGGSFQIFLIICLVLKKMPQRESCKALTKLNKYKVS